MIHLYSNVYLTYFETQQPDWSDGIIIGAPDRKNNFISATNSRWRGRYTTMEELFGNDGVQEEASFLKLYEESQNGEIKTLLYMDAPNFRRFIIRWLYSGFNKASKETLFQIYMFYRSFELTKFDRVKVFGDNNTSCDPTALVDTYWNIPKEEFLTMDIKKFTFPNELYRSIGYEHVVSNAILGNQYYQKRLKELIPFLYNEKIEDRAVHIGMIYTVWALSHCNDWDMKSDFYELMVQKYPIMGRISENSQLGYDLVEVSKEVDEVVTGKRYVSSPICRRIKEIGHYTVDEIYADIIGDDKLEIMTRLYDSGARYNQLLPALVKKTMNPELLSFTRW